MYLYYLNLSPFAIQARWNFLKAPANPVKNDSKSFHRSSL